MVHGALVPHLLPHSAQRPVRPCAGAGGMFTQPIDLPRVDFPRIDAFALALALAVTCILCVIVVILILVLDVLIFVLVDNVGSFSSLPPCPFSSCHFPRVHEPSLFKLHRLYKRSERSYWDLASHYSLATAATMIASAFLTQSTVTCPCGGPVS